MLGDCKITLIKLENISLQQISVIDVNHYRIYSVPKKAKAFFTVSHFYASLIFADKNRGANPKTRVPKEDPIG